MIEMWSQLEGDNIKYRLHQADLTAVKYFYFCKYYLIFTNMSVEAVMVKLES